MDNFDNKKLQQRSKSAPEGMYNKVRERIVQERIQRTRTRQQLTVGAALLLIIGVVNVSLILFVHTKKLNVEKVSTEQMLYNTYFDNQMTLSDEK